MGRPGTAYSFLTRDELPYLLDLHLFLGRQVKAAPLAPPPDLLDPAAALAAAQAPDAPALYGAFPAPLISPQAERLREVEAAAPELSGAARSLANAFSLYVRTRPAASPESVARAKQLPKEGAHPALLAQLPGAQRLDLQAEAELASFTAALRSFRPAATVFEAEIAPARAGGGAAGGGGVALAEAAQRRSTSDVMQKKRAAHGAAIEQQRLKRARAAEDAERQLRQQGGAERQTSSGGEDDDEDEEAGGDDDGEQDGADEDEAPGGGRGAASRRREQAAAVRQAAVLTMELGDGVLNEGKYRCVCARSVTLTRVGERVPG